MKFLRVVLATVLMLSFTLSALAAEKVTIYAAASTTDMLTELIDAYNKQGGNAVGSFASSGVLARQIEAGAPADIFISANQEWMDYLAEKKLVADGTRKNWLGNTLVLIAPSDSKASYKFAKGAKLSGLIAKEKLAIGDPNHVPAGTYAKQAMENLGIWSDIEKNIAAAENVRVVLTLVSRGEAPLGIVFGSDYVAAKDTVKLIDTVPADAFDTISYPIGIITKHDNAEVKKFYNFLMTDSAKAVINKYGFELL